MFPGAVMNVQEGDVGKTLNEASNVSGLKASEFAFLKSMLLRLRFLSERYSRPGIGSEE
jgi:hypothetical protein